jgi:hypothetical protein
VRQQRTHTLLGNTAVFVNKQEGFTAGERQYKTNTSFGPVTVLDNEKDFTKHEATKYERVYG